MKGFDSGRFRELFGSMEWASIEEIRDAVREDGVVSESFRENAFEEALTAAIRQELRKTDPATGEALGVSVIGMDGERRYKAPSLFDSSDFRKVRGYHYGRAVYHGTRVRHWEERAGMEPAEQLDLNLSWIDETEQGAGKVLSGARSE